MKNLNYSDIEWRPKNSVSLKNGEEKEIENMLELLEDDDDIQKVFHNWYSVGYSLRECLLNYLNKLRTRLLESKISMLTPPCSRIDILMKRGDLGFLMIAHSCMVAFQNYCSLGCSE